MIARILPHALRGELRAIPSKSEAHRALICAALANAPTLIRIGASSEDIEATLRCLTAFGASFARGEGQIRVQPIAHPPVCCEADCGESGSTLRFLLPVAAALGIDCAFRMHGRLSQRPIAPLERELVRGGCAVTRPQAEVLRVSGRLRAGAYALPGNISSQYVSGMLFALPLLDGESRLTITGTRESESYVRMTLQTLARFGVAPDADADGYTIRAGGLRGCGEIAVGGDWSNGAVWRCVDLLPDCDVRVHGLDADSAQGDRQIEAILRDLRRGSACVMDAADTPDLVPAVAACACALGKELTVVHAERLRIKESDRLRSVTRTLNALGGHVEETPDGLIVHAGAVLRGGDADACGDHRIAMLAAIASCACSGAVTLRGAEAVNKSYPDFWKDFAALGGQVRLAQEV